MSSSEEKLEQNPVFQVIQKMEELRLSIHSNAYNLYYYRDKLTQVSEGMKNSQTLMRAGFPPTLNEEEMGKLQKYIPTLEKGVSVFSQRLDKCRKLGLGQYLNSELRAMELEFKIVRSVKDSEWNWELRGAPSEELLQILVEHLRLLNERDDIFPLWGLLEYKRKTGSTELIETPSEHCLLPLIWEILTNDFRRPSHVCDKNRFYCQYLDDELRNMYNFVAKRLRDPEKEAWDVAQKIIFTVDDVEFCEELLKLGDVVNELGEGVAELVSLKLYRACIQRGQFELADEWMETHYSIVTPSAQEQFASFLRRTSLGLEECRGKTSGQAPRARVQLNGRHVGVSDNYTLPVLRENFTTSSQKPWWILRVMTKTALACDQEENIKIESRETSRESWNSQATTEGPPEASTRDSFWDKSPEERSELHQLQNLEANRAAAAFYRDHSRVSSADMSRELPLCCIDVDLAEGLKIKWKNNIGEKQERRTNLQIGKPYHCRIFSYDAVSDEWIGNDTFCRFTSQLDVKQEGGSRVPILGNGGDRFFTRQRPLFKMYRDAGDHRLDKYLADIRAQSVAAYHAERFRERTEDKFKCLSIVTAKLLFIYATCERQTIIEMATREVLISGSHVHDAEKFGKFTNNWSWKNRNVRSDIFEAFSHFTYDDSDGAIMATDIQGFAVPGGLGGIHYLLTDPVIHSQARDTQTFGRTNYGTEGMNEFFASVHKECNHICEFLKLKRPEDESSSRGSSSD